MLCSYRYICMSFILELIIVVLLFEIKYQYLNNIQVHPKNFINFSACLKDCIEIQVYIKYNKLN